MASDRSKRERVAFILNEPDLFPDEFKAWLPRMLESNPNFRVGELQLPEVEQPHFVGGSGEAAFAGAWVNYGSGYQEVNYYRDPFQRVFLSGLAKSGVIGTTIFTLPAGYRPRARLIFIQGVGSDTGNRIDIMSDGTVVPMGGTNGYVSLEGIHFRAYG
jgi:hypothetical protein